MNISFKLVTTALLVLVIMGCSESTKKDNSVISFGEDIYFVPQNVSIETKTDNLARLSSGEHGELAGGVIVQEPGFYAPSLANSYDRSSQSLNDINNVIESLNYPIYSITNLTSQVYTSPFEYAQSEYTIESYSATTSQYIRDSILDEILGTDNAQEPEQSEYMYSKFNVAMSVIVKDNYKYFIMSVFPNSLYKEYRALANSITNGTNLASENTEIAPSSDEFVGQETKNSADFLFVIDDSGSMSDNQVGIAKAADDFASALENSGIGNYNIAIITTSDNINNSSCTTSSYYNSGCAGRIVNQYGIFDNIDDFKTHVLVGDNGDSTETGIYNSEKALESNGILSAKGFPSNPLSVIILSDEESQYSWRDYTQFDTSDNLFIDNNYIVYPIINLYSDNQYSQLANATGGSTANIDDIDNFPIIMETIAINAGGSSSTFILTDVDKIENAYVVRIDSVKVNGKSIPESSQNGYSYNIAGKRINFYGSSIPREGDKISVDYTYAITTIK